jgi:hypothetical protein
MFFYYLSGVGDFGPAAGTGVRNRIGDFGVAER